MIIKIRTLDSRTHEFDVDPQITIGRLKEFIAPALNIDSERLRLIFKGCVLQDISLVGNCGVEDAVIHAVERLPGPPSTPYTENASNNNPRHPSDQQNAPDQISRIVQGILQGFHSSVIDSQGRTTSINSRHNVCRNLIDHLNLQIQNFAPNERFDEFLYQFPRITETLPTYNRPEFATHMELLRSFQASMRNFGSILDSYVNYCAQAPTNMARNTDQNLHSAYQLTFHNALHSISHILHHFSDFFIQYNPNNQEQPFDLIIPTRSALRTIPTTRNSTQASTGSIHPPITANSNPASTRNSFEDPRNQTVESNPADSNPHPGFSNITEALRNTSQEFHLPQNQAPSDSNGTIGYQLTVQLFTDIVPPLDNHPRLRQQSGLSTNAQPSQISPSTQTQASQDNPPATTQLSQTSRRRTSPITGITIPPNQNGEVCIIPYCPQDLLLTCNSLFSSSTLELPVSGITRLNRGTLPPGAQVINNRRNRQQQVPQTDPAPPNREYVSHRCTRSQTRRSTASTTTPETNPPTQNVIYEPVPSDILSRINANFPPSVAPVIRRDISRQRGREPLSFSDAYLHSCTNKKRKLDEQDESTRFLQMPLNEAFIQSVQGIADESVDIANLYNSIAGDATLNSEYQKMMEKNLINKIKHSEIDSERYPECHNYSQNDKS